MGGAGTLPFRVTPRPAEGEAVGTGAALRGAIERALTRAEGAAVGRSWHHGRDPLARGLWAGMKGSSEEGDMNDVRLDLDAADAKALRTALSIRLVGMREELVHTDDRDYREGLKAATERLEGVLARLEQAMGLSATVRS